MRPRSHPLFKRLSALLLLLLVLPYGLTLVYWFVPPVSTPMIADTLMFKRVHRDWVPLSSMSPNLVAAVIASEDGAFCDHYGVDFRQMEKSITKAIDTRRPVRATSTITMQTVKNLFLWNGRSWLRKALEAPLTFWMELTWNKRRILEVYLNVVKFDEGVYGAESAALHHFGTSARNLNLYQASQLAAVLPNPERRNASAPGPAQMLIASTIQRRVASSGPDLSCIRR